MRNQRSLTLLLLGLVLLGPAACSEDPSPTGVQTDAQPVPMDRVTVTFQWLAVLASCDGDLVGEFGYKFYVIEQEDGLRVDQYLSDSEVRVEGRVGTFLGFPRSVTFRIPRSESRSFVVVFIVGEYDGSTQQFSQGEFIRHEFSADPHWSPGFVERRFGTDPQRCQLQGVYSVEVEPVELGGAGQTREVRNSTGEEAGERSRTTPTSSGIPTPGSRRFDKRAV